MSDQQVVSVWGLQKLGTVEDLRFRTFRTHHGIMLTILALQWVPVRTSDSALSLMQTAVLAVTLINASVRDQGIIGSTQTTRCEITICKFISS